MCSWIHGIRPKSSSKPAMKKGFHVIAMLKTNRILYPERHRRPSQAVRRYLDLRDTRLVTVGNERYRVYRYEDALNGLDDAVVLLTWKADQPDDTRTSSLRLEHRSGAE